MMYITLSSKNVYKQLEKNQFCYIDISGKFYSVALKQRYAACATFACVGSVACCTTYD